MAAGDIAYEYSFFLLPVSKTAAANITKGQLVDLDGGDPADSGDYGPFGIAIDDIAANEDMKGKVLIKGVAYATAGGAISALTYVKAGTDGKVVDFVEGTDTEALIAGVALEAASGDGDVIKIMLL